jgi:hypothetical protein
MLLPGRGFERQGEAAREGWLGQGAQKRSSAPQARQFGAARGAGWQMRPQFGAFLLAQFVVQQRRKLLALLLPIVLMLHRTALSQRVYAGRIWLACFSVLLFF